VYNDQPWEGVAPRLREVNSGSGVEGAIRRCVTHHRFSGLLFSGHARYL